MPTHAEFDMPSRVYDGIVGRIYVEKFDATARTSMCDRCGMGTA